MGKYIAYITTYSRVPSRLDPIFHDISYGIAMTVAEHRSDFKLTTDTSYPALSGELLGVCFKHIVENWQRYNGTALYIQT